MTFRSVLKTMIGIDNGKSNPGSDSLNINDIGELYHDFSLFGVRNAQLPGPFYLNQCCKAPIIQSYIALAIAKSKKNIDDQVTFAELFCADGYYAMVATLFGDTKSFGIDNNKDGYLDKAFHMAHLLK